MYAKGGATCTLEPSSLEWDMVLAEVNHMRMLVQKITKEFLYTQKDLNTTSGGINMPVSMAAMSVSLHKLAYGDAAHNIHTPPSQAVSNKLFAIIDAYTTLAGKLSVDKVDVDVLTEVATMSADLTGHMEELMALYIDDAWEKDKSVEGAK